MRLKRSTRCLVKSIQLDMQLRILFIKFFSYYHSLNIDEKIKLGPMIRNWTSLHKNINQDRNENATAFRVRTRLAVTAVTAVTQKVTSLNAI